jgi:hypothetical protein
MVDSCPPHLSGEEVYNMLIHNFKRHYNTNKAPYGLYFHTTWFKKPVYLAAFKVTFMSLTHIIHFNSITSPSRNLHILFLIAVA